jgi:hypothetical protein
MPRTRDRPPPSGSARTHTSLGRVNHAACAFLAPAAMPSDPDGLGGSVEDRLGIVLQAETKGGYNLFLETAPRILPVPSIRGMPLPDSGTPGPRSATTKTCPPFSSVGESPSVVRERLLSLPFRFAGPPPIPIVAGQGLTTFRAGEGLTKPKFSVTDPVPAGTFCGAWANPTMLQDLEVTSMDSRLALRIRPICP